MIKEFSDHVRTINSQQLVKRFIIARIPQRIYRTTNHSDRFLMAYSDDSLTMNPCCKLFILKIVVKGWALLVVLP